MDEIAKTIKIKNKGCTIPGHHEKMGCLLWMDDVVLITDKPQELQEMLNITHETASKYHIEIGAEKSKCLVIGTKIEPNLNIGPMKIETTDRYKYLGEFIDKKISLELNIKEARSRSEGTLQAILAIAGDPFLKGIQMETIWK
jgi:hypothetical protein